MSSRKSDSPPGRSSDPAAPSLDYAPREKSSPLVRSIRSNLPIPILLLLLIPLGGFLESPHVGGYVGTVLTFMGYNIILAVSLQLINGFSGQFSLGHAGFMAVGAYLSAYPAVTYSHRLRDPAACLLFFISLLIVTSLAGVLLFVIFTLIRRSRTVASWLPMVLLIGLIVWVLVDFARGSVHQPERLPARFIWSHLTQKLQELFAWMIGAGIGPAAGISHALPESIQRPASFLILLLGGGACAAIVGWVVGLPALRLRGDYLAIATLGMGEIIRIAFQNSPPLGGALGIIGIPKYTDFVWLYGAAVVTIVVIWRLAYSAKGRAIMAVREDEIAAAAVGIDTTRLKVTAFVVGAFFAGEAGVLYAMHEFSITPGTFSMARSIEIVVMVTLGGLGSISGAILAAIVLTILPEVLRNMGAEIADYRMIIYSALLIVMMLVRPQGLLGGRELWPGKWSGPRRRPVTTEDRDDKDAPAAQAI